MNFFQILKIFHEYLRLDDFELLAAGRIPTKFPRREREILTSRRMMDRSVRPLAAKGFVEEVGISCCMLVVEDSEVLAINDALRFLFLKI
jgi:polyribonucleotide nucleotidyltransferase